MVEVFLSEAGHAFLLESSSGIGEPRGEQTQHAAELRALRDALFAVPFVSSSA